jgi:hypothetical protein
MGPSPGGSNDNPLAPDVVPAYDAVLFAPSARAAPWTNGDYLYRYVFWRTRHQISPSDNYKLFGYHPVKNASPAFHFISTPVSLPSTVEYRDGGTVKRVELDSLLRNTGRKRSGSRSVWNIPQSGASTARRTASS